MSRKVSLRVAAERLEDRLLLTAQIYQAGYFATWNANPQVIPSTDPADVAYDPRNGHLTIVDSEIDELPEYRNGATPATSDNAFEVSLTGDTLYRAIKTKNIEPTGLVYSPFDGYWYMTSDDNKKIMRFDDRLDTVLLQVDTRTQVPSADDSEAITVDPATGTLYVAHGVDGGIQVVVYDSNLNYLYHFPVGTNGFLEDAEGIAFHSPTGHLFVNGKTKIAEFTTTGDFIQGFDMGAFSPTPRTPQGLVFAPSSNPFDNPNQLSLYIADGGIDNFPDGGIYEAAFSGLFPGNAAPVVNAGPDQTFISALPSTAILSGTVSDDGLPPPTQLSHLWMQVGGSGTAVIANPTQLNTSVSLPVSGSYVFRLVGTDGESISTDEVTINVNITVLDRQISAISDDAEQSPTGGVVVNSPKFELTTRNDGTVQKLGLRFANMSIPVGATVSRAYIQFESIAAKDDPTSLLVEGQASDNAVTFATQNSNITNRPRTAVSVAWEPPAWNVIGEAGVNQRTPDLKAIVQEIVNRPGWSPNNALAFIITGTGSRHANSFEGVPAGGAAILHVEFYFNTAPVADAGADKNLVVNNMSTSVALGGSASDDGLPVPSNLTSQWTKVSGPGTATFANAAAPSTTVVFSAPGQYVLRLTASDGEKTATDDVTVSIALNAPPVVNAGPDQNASVPNLSASVALSGQVTDDNLPTASPSTTTWTKVSGPGTVTFGNAGAASTSAVFSAVGQYVLRLTADDGLATASDDVVINVIINAAPQVNAGPDMTVLLTGNPTTVTLAGQVTDDNLPAPTNLTILWTLVNGPAAVTFGNASQAGTTVNFTTTGQYTLRLSANDGAITTTDDVIVNVALNAPPQVNAGPDLNPTLATLGSSVTLAGHVSDDGLPAPANLTSLWTVVSGPGSVSFANASQPSTTATFSAVGSYILRLTGSDGTASASDDVTVNVQLASAPQALDVRTITGDDDAEETYSPSHNSYVTDAALDIGDNRVGLRYQALNIPAGAIITSAYIQFRADKAGSLPTTVEIRAQADDNPPTFAAVPNNLSSRPTTAASASWTIAPWTTVGEIGANQRTPDIAAVIQEVISRPGWAAGNALAILFSGTGGSRAASSYQRSPATSPLLHIEYVVGQTNTPPQVSAGADQSITVNMLAAAVASINGSVVDDGLPIPPGAVTAQWTTISGPGTVTFGNSAAASTTATFSAAGQYVLRLTGNDGLATVSDDVTVTINLNAAPQVNAGPDLNPVLSSLLNPVTLDGIATDDGLPAPANLAIQWTKISGPGNVSFANASAANTTATFSAEGQYVLRLTAGDGLSTTSDDVTVTVSQGVSSQTFEARTITGDDDAEETKGASHNVYVVDAALDLGSHYVALRYQNLEIPFGATITSAYVQFRADKTNDGVTTVVIRGQAADNAPTFVATPNNISTRPTTAANSVWTIPAWTAGEIGAGQQTPDLTAIIQEIIDRPGWAANNALALIIDGAGARAASSFNRNPATSPLLHIEYTAGGAATNFQPQVNAGADRDLSFVSFPTSAVALNGTATDDGLPFVPGVLTLQWTKVSGPGTVNFANPAAASTTATFSAAGQYVLRLTADDGALVASDEVTFMIRQNLAPTVNAGADVNQTVTSLSTPVSLSGSTTDDGLPAPANLAVQWTKVSGPGNVTFASAAVASTTATFSAAGQYVLRLTANDGQLSTSDDVTVTVQLNNAPAVNAGADVNQSLLNLSTPVSLSGSASDDGLPAPANLVLLWTKISGPGNVSFGNSAAASTTATFSAFGTYVLRLTANDGQLSGFDEVTVTVQQTVVSTYEARTITGDDDGEETYSASHNSYTVDASLDLAKGYVGLRYQNVNIPPGATITAAYIQFRADKSASGATTAIIRGQAADNPATFAATTANISTRPTTSASTSWTIAAWTAGDISAAQKTPDLAAVIQEIINRPGWASGNSLAIIIDGTGERNASSYNRNPATSPLLHVEYTGGSSGGSLMAAMFPDTGSPTTQAATSVKSAENINTATPAAAATPVATNASVPLVPASTSSTSTSRTAATTQASSKTVKATDQVFSQIGKLSVLERVLKKYK